MDAAAAETGRTEVTETEAIENIHTIQRYRCFAVSWLQLRCNALMSHPFEPIPAESTPPLQLLLAPLGSLSGDGQLHELMQERRRHDRQPQGDGGLWYLPAHLCRQRFGRDGVEGMVLRDCSSALWLQLRFGGELHGVTLQPDWLARMAMALPPAAPRTALEHS
jgi:hypothetical protein